MWFQRPSQPFLVSVIDDGYYIIITIITIIIIIIIIISASFPATMLSQPLSESDSDLDDHVPIKRPAKKAAILSSDEDD